MGISNPQTGYKTIRIQGKGPAKRLGSISPAERENKNLELCERIKNGDQRAFEEMVKLNMPMLLRITSSPYNHLEPDDALQEAKIMLQKVALQYDPSYNVRFGSFAYTQISLIIKSLNIRAHKPSGLRLPQAISQILRKVQAIRAKDETNGLPQRPNKELSEMLGISIEKLEVALNHINLLNNTVSLDNSAGLDDDAPLLHEKISNQEPNENQFEVASNRQSIRKKLMKAINERVITSRETAMLFAFYGINGTDEEGLSYQKIADSYNLTRERVRQIINTAILKLQRSGYLSEFKD